MNDEVILNKHGVNAAIGYNVLSDDEMRKLGFTDHREGYWYYFHSVSDDGEVTFNVTIDKAGIDDLRIDILDEAFGQPYDFQYILERTPDIQYAKDVKEAVEAEMQRLQEAGVLFGHEYGEYI